MLNSPVPLPPQAGIVRLWREGTTAVLALYLLLAASADALVHVGNGHGFRAELGTMGKGLAVTAFLLWRVWRGGYISWAVLFVLNGGAAVLAGAFWLANGGADHAAVFALCATGLVLLASPAARSQL